MALDIPPGTPNRGPGMETISIILLILTTLATATRVASKFVFQAKQRWWWDDFFAILSWVIETTVLIMCLVWKNIGLGLHVEDLAMINASDIVKGAKLLFFATFFFDSSICLPKLSAICFYARVFQNEKTFSIQLWVIGGLVVGWLVASMFSTIFQCAPINKAWNSMIPGHCIDYYPWYLATATLSCLVDFYILILPIPKIWALNMALRKRVYLLAAFFLTYSVIVLSVGRLIAITQVIPKLQTDLNWEMPLFLYWALLEGSISIISISVPSIFSLVKILFGKHWNTNRGTTNSSARLYSKGSRNAPGLGIRRRALDSFDELVGGDQISSEIEARSRLGLSGRSDDNIPLNAIHIQQEVRVT